MGLPIIVTGVNATPKQISATAQTLYDYNITNPNAYAVYVKFYDKLAANVNGTVDTPALTVTCAASAITAASPSTAFATAVSVRCVTANETTDKNPPANSPVLELNFTSATGTGDALTTNPLSQFAATTSAQLRGVLSDETGTGAAVFATSPTFVTPALGTPASGNLSNCTGVATGNDGNNNYSANNFLPGFATTATAAGTTTLTITSANTQIFTGTTTQNCKLPVTSTLVQGHAFLVVNQSTGVVTVQSSGANTVVSLAAGTSAKIICVLTSGTTAASWLAISNATLTTTIASGTATLGTSAITSGSLATVVTVGATGVLTTDTLNFSFNADVSAVTGYAPATAGGLIIYGYPTADNVNFKVGNPTSFLYNPGCSYPQLACRPLRI